jgi:monoamine oxidase
VIVGGGFAGVTTARELTMRGRSAVLVEARDRLGGRTYTADHDGHPMELGGTWVHPLQPRVWAEIDRYGSELETFPVLEGLRKAVVSGGRRRVSGKELGMNNQSTDVDVVVVRRFRRPDGRAEAQGGRCFCCCP